MVEATLNYLAPMEERPYYYTYPPPVYAPAPPSAYWYYCRSAGAYYPTVPSCPEPWVPVPPRY